MKCPYNRKSETQLQNWNQNPDDNQNFTDGKTVTQTVFNLWTAERKIAEHGMTESAAMRLLVYVMNKNK